MNSWYQQFISWKWLKVKTACHSTMVLPSLYHDTAIVSFVESVIKEQNHIITENEMLIYTVCVFGLQKSHCGCRTYLCTVWYKRVQFCLWCIIPDDARATVRGCTGHSSFQRRQASFRWHVPRPLSLVSLLVRTTCTCNWFYAEVVHHSLTYTHTHCTHICLVLLVLLSTTITQFLILPMIDILEIPSIR